MRFKIEGKEYDWDNTRFTVGESIFLDEKTGMGLLEFQNGLIARRGRAETALIYFAKRRAGEAIRWQDMDGINLGTLEFLPDEEAGQESEGEAKSERPNPTSSAGKSRRRGTSATS